MNEKDWSVGLAESSHFQPYLHAHGTRFERDGFSLVYSGDSGPSASIAKLAIGCDVLVHMCYYVSGTQLNDGFTESCTGHLELAHVARSSTGRD